MFKCLKQSLAEVNYHWTGHHVTDRHTFTIYTSSPTQNYKVILSLSDIIASQACISISLKLLHPREISGQEMEQRKPFDPNYTCVTLAQQLSSAVKDTVTCPPSREYVCHIVTLPQQLSRQEKVGSASNSSPLPSDSFYKIIIHLYSTIFIQPDLFKSFQTLYNTYTFSGPTFAINKAQTIKNNFYSVYI